MVVELYKIICVCCISMDLSTCSHPNYQHKKGLIDEEWDIFKSKFNKVYKGIEEIRRKSIFMSNLQEIVKHNDLYEKGLVSFKMAMNKYGDINHDEFHSIFGSFMKFSISSRTESEVSYSVFKSSYEVLGVSHNLSTRSLGNHKKPNYIPWNFDWRHRGAVTRVKDQGLCGSCYAFSATGALEAQYYRRTKKQKSLSAQQILDCSGHYGNKGCGGGLPEYAFEYLMKSKNKTCLQTEEDYEYVGDRYHSKKYRYESCHKRPSKCALVVEGYKILPKSEKTLKYKVATHGPVSVVLKLNKDFLFYSEGVFYSKKPCAYSHRRPASCSHAMLVVGYGSSRKKGDYWILKNSWGTDWGEKGYMKLARNRGNHRGIVNLASIVYLM